ncbi:hypothetical protein MKZ38_006040 [Zalerion maritima]|uniref:FUN14 family protein n=1 Tax=Zalerion maritima TaxID=339359 RepID=A0AAD5RKA5_9PEZI|nr:hypothetical protein MKZ38_006040 [Zalerion maritima]
MATLTFARAAMLRRGVGRGVPLCATVGLGAFVITSNLRRPIRLDTAAAPYSSKLPVPKEKLNPETIRQLAGGSAAGFLAGVVVSVFSKTLVLFTGIFMVAVQVAARYGIDLIQHFQVKDRLKSSRFIALLRNHPTFKLSFALTFALAAFAHF